VTGSLANLSILIIDDSQYLRRLLVTMLHGMGAKNVSVAESARDGLKVLEKKQVDIVLVDWMMNGMSGLGFIKALRQSPHEDMKYMPIIMMTGHTEKENIEVARDVGVTEFLAKPFTARALFMRLEALVERPRPFIKTRTYFGPDRRRRGDEAPAEERRRNAPRRTTRS